MNGWKHTFLAGGTVALLLHTPLAAQRYSGAQQLVYDTKDQLAIPGRALPIVPGAGVVDGRSAFGLALRLKSRPGGQVGEVDVVRSLDARGNGFRLFLRRTGADAAELVFDYLDIDHGDGIRVAVDARALIARGAEDPGWHHLAVGVVLPRIRGGAGAGLIWIDGGAAFELAFTPQLSATAARSSSGLVVDFTAFDVRDLCLTNRLLTPAELVRLSGPKPVPACEAIGRPEASILINPPLGGSLLSLYPAVIEPEVFGDRVLPVVPTTTTGACIGPPPNCRWDLNCDGVVGNGDRDQLLGLWGRCTSSCCPADFNGDGVVGSPDLLELLAHYGACPCPWDINGDGSVNTPDFLVLDATWGTCPSGTCACPADFNHDGVVDTQDFLELMAHWGACP